MTLGVLPLMTQKEAVLLNKEGLDPIDWASPRMISEFWNCNKTAISAAKHRGNFDSVESVRAGNRLFYRKWEALIAYSSQEVNDEQKFEILGSLPEQLKAERESGVYDLYKTPPPTDRIEELAEHQLHRDAQPRVGDPIPAHEPKPIAQQSIAIPVAETNPKYNKVASRFPARKVFEKDYLEAMADIVTLPDWEAIVVKAINQAANGDSKARQWLSDFLIGKPITRIATIQQVKNTIMGEDERSELMNAIFSKEISGEAILDVEPINIEDDSDDDPYAAEIGGWDTGAQHVVGSTFEK